MVSNKEERSEQESVHGEQPGGTGDSYDEAVSRFVERFAAELTEAGMQRMASRVFACLLASETGCLNSAELSERLSISPAAVSGAVRYLSQMRLVIRERQPGSRREGYRVHADTWYEAISHRDAIVLRWISTFLEGAEALGPDTPAGRRISETVEFFRFMDIELRQMMERWTEHRKRLSLQESDGRRSTG